MYAPPQILLLSLSGHPPNLLSDVSWPRRSETRRYTSWTSGFRRQMPKHRRTRGRRCGQHQALRISLAKTGSDFRSLSSAHPDRLAWQSEPVRCPLNEESRREIHHINARRATAARPETLHALVGHTVSVRVPVSNLLAWEEPSATCQSLAFRIFGLYCPCLHSSTSFF